MQFALTLLALVATAFAAPAPIAATPKVAAAGSCKYDYTETWNMAHNHDINSGIVKTGKTLKQFKAPLRYTTHKDGPCSPAWAVGGAIDDATPTLYSADKVTKVA